MSNTDTLTMLVGLAGAAAVTVGAAMLHPSAGCITGGGFALAWSYLAARAGARNAGGR